MATVKRLKDLEQYAGVLPYASEIFGVYQPLLGWKSKRIMERFAAGRQNDRDQILRGLERAVAHRSPSIMTRRAKPVSRSRRVWSARAR